MKKSTIKVRPFTRKLFNGMTEAARGEFLVRVQSAVSHWADELCRELNENVLQNLSLGRGLSNRDVKRGLKNFNAGLSSYSANCTLLAEWKELMAKKS